MNEVERLTGGLVGTDLLEPLDVRPWMGGVQAVWRFSNGRGASLISHRGSYGVELAVTRYLAEGAYDFELDYSTPITSDVVGHVDGPEDLTDLLQRIQSLPAPAGEGTGYSTGDSLQALDSLARMLDQ
jgi:hypothetical protein